MTHSIGGLHSACAVYEALGARDRHRPADPALLVAEIRRLAATGLTSRDVAQALRLDWAYVARSLGEAPDLINSP